MYFMYKTFLMIYTNIRYDLKHVKGFHIVFAHDYWVNVG